MFFFYYFEMFFIYLFIFERNLKTEIYFFYGGRFFLPLRPPFCKMTQKHIHTHTNTNTTHTQIRFTQ